MSTKCIHPADLPPATSAIVGRPVGHAVWARQMAKCRNAPTSLSSGFLFNEPFTGTRTHPMPTMISKPRRLSSVKFRCLLAGQWWSKSLATAARGEIYGGLVLLTTSCIELWYAQLSLPCKVCNLRWRRPSHRLTPASMCLHPAR